MAAEVYRRLCEAMIKRGGEYPGMEIPEFYALVEELFTPQEAEVYLAIPRGYHPANVIAAELDKVEEEVASILEDMANKGLCGAGRMGETTFYGCLPFVPGIFEFQFMRGTDTPEDKKIARLIHAYKAVVDAAKGHRRLGFQRQGSFRSIVKYKPAIPSTHMIRSHPISRNTSLSL